MKLCGHDVGLERPLFLIAGPDTLESEQLCMDVAGTLKEHTARLGMPYVFKGSFDKANRSSGASYRGPGMDEGLRILEAVKTRIGVPVLTDVHEDTPLAEVAAVVDVIQTPAFLCRQTNFIRNAASQGKPLNIKKGQFLSPWEMKNVVDKAMATGNRAIMVCERGFSFGYNNLVVGHARHSRSCATPAARSCSTPPIRCNCRAGRAPRAADRGSSSRCWHGPRRPPASRAFSWKPIPDPTRRCATGRMPGRSR